MFERAEMLDDYFSIEINEEKRLVTLPEVLEGFVPNFNRLPDFIMRICTEVDWEDEENCFRTFCSETAKFYAPRDEDSNYERAFYDTRQHRQEVEDEEEKDETKSLETRVSFVIEHVVFAAMKRHLFPPKSCADDMTVVQV